MSAIQRSKSESSVTAVQPFLAPRNGDALRAHRPQIVRHCTSLALANVSGSRSATCSGYQTPRTERIEDPFSLGGFFPPQLPGTENPTDEWAWLREDRETDSDSDQPPHDGVWSTDGYEPRFGKAEDEEAAQTIRLEDKLGVLSLRTSPCYRRVSDRIAEIGPCSHDVLIQ